MMILKSKEKLIAAKVNLDNKLYEDSISRSYYAIFHIISAVLFTKNLTFSSHNQVIGAFNKEYIFTNIFPKDFNKMIERLFRLRQSCDYDIESNIKYEQANSCFNDANMIISKCRDYLSNIYKVENIFWD
jgi:hypothetical protein